MTTAIFTATAPVTQIPVITTPKGLYELGRFIAVFFDAHADKDSTFRGLDLNGKAM